MSDLRTAAQQALEALQWHYRQGHSNTLGGFRLKIDEKALRELRAALVQQDEPHPDYPCRSDGRCQYAIDHGAEGLGSCPKGKCAIAQPQPAEDRAVAQDNLRVMREMFGEQAEPVEPVAWECKAGGLKPLTQRQYDAQTAATKRHYTRIAPPQRKPLTLEEAQTLLKAERIWLSNNTAFRITRVVERAHGIKE